MVVISCGAMWRMVPDKIGLLPDPSLEPQAWEQRWSQSPGGCVVLVRLLGVTNRRQPRTASDTLSETPELLLNLDAEEEDSGDDGFLRGQCDRVVGSMAAPKLHSGRANCGGFSALARTVVVGACCPGCGTNFR